MSNEMSTNDSKLVQQARRNSGELFSEENIVHEDIISRLDPNTIYTGSYPNQAGKYISILFDQVVGLDISKQIRLQIRIGYLDKKKKLRGLRISKWRCTKNKCEEVESVSFSTFDFDAFIYPIIPSNKKPLNNEWFDANSLQYSCIKLPEMPTLLSLPSFPAVMAFLPKDRSIHFFMGSIWTVRLI